MIQYLLDLVHQWRYRHRITEAHLAEILRHEDTRGIDFVSWRSPAELEAMREGT